MGEECGMASPRRYPLIFNPKARSQKGGRVLRFLMSHANRFAMYATNHAGEARDLAARFAREGEPVVIAAGCHHEPRRAIIPSLNVGGY